MLAATFLALAATRVEMAVFVVQAWCGEAAGLRVDVGQLPVPAPAVRLVVVGTVAVPTVSRVEEELRWLWPCQVQVPSSAAA